MSGVSCPAAADRAGHVQRRTQGNDGKPLTINGVHYAKSMGGHAPTEIIYYIGEQCSHVSVFVGIDDERDEKQAASATFQLWADGVPKADNGLRTSRDDPVALSADLTGARFLRLVETDGGDTNSYDRADWAAPTLICGEI
ncbi:NPCBM/NEW2 domain-containing protein [Actinocrispum sp. NPDC049592]|uniref:NPCBM/NEW2 domain-containing protein n=1 Tax=Actinocrispum sp. NPDC049592 TaxID=3154835 RepID=UPI0034193A98